MRSVRAWWHRCVGLVFRVQRDRDFAEELESHLQMHIADNVRAGMTEAEARRVALLKLGGVEQARERYHDQSSIPAIETIVRDLQFAARMMRRSPGFTAVVLATLAVGIGANTVMFSVVNTVLLRPLPYADPARLVSVRPVDGPNRTLSYAAPPDFYRYRSDNRTLDALDAFYNQSVNLTGGLEPERLPALVVSAGFFSCLGSGPVLGRGFIPQDEQWGSHRVVILSDALWRRRFAADPAIVGQQVHVNGEPHTVAGVLGPNFSFLNADAPLFLPMAFEHGDNLNSHSNYFLRMIGRLKPQVSRQQADTDLNAISDAIIAEQSVNQGTAISVAPLQDALVRNIRQPILILLGAVVFVLLICCANLANLLLARAVGRQREIAVRVAVGATRGRLLRQFLIESLLLSLTGGAIGLAIAYLAANAINAISTQVLPRAEDIRVDPAVLMFTFAIATVTGVLLGLAPAAHDFTPTAESLKDTARAASDPTSRQRLRGAMVVAEVALSLILLAGAGLMVKSLYRLLTVDAGFQTKNVLTVQVSLPARKYVDRELERRFDPRAYVRASQFFDEVIDRVRSLPAATAVGAINGLPVMGEIWGKNVTLFDRPLPADMRGLSPIQYRVVAGDYFRALGIRILSGRAFTDRDTQEAPKVAIVNRAMVRRDWNGQDPIGTIISVNPPLELLPQSVIDEARRAGALPDDYAPDKLTIVGVADDVRYGTLGDAAVPLVYTPYAQGSEGETDMFLIVRSDRDPLTLVDAIRDQVAQVDRDQPIASVQTMDTRVAASVARPRLQTNVLAAFALVAIFLAGIGIYGVLSYAVTERTKEIGIRLALGAAPREVIALVLGRGFRLVGAGVAVGILSAVLLTRLLRTLLFEVSPSDPTVFVAIVLLVAVIAWMAAYVPARRAARLDPITTLRTE